MIHPKYTLHYPSFLAIRDRLPIKSTTRSHSVVVESGPSTWASKVRDGGDSDNLRFTHVLFPLNRHPVPWDTGLAVRQRPLAPRRSGWTEDQSHQPVNLRMRRWLACLRCLKARRATANHPHLRRLLCLVLPVSVPDSKKTWYPRRQPPSILCKTFEASVLMMLVSKQERTVRGDF